MKISGLITEPEIHREKLGNVEVSPYSLPCGERSQAADTVKNPDGKLRLI